MRRPVLWPRHAAMSVVCAVMLVPFYWVAKTAVTNENIYAYPPNFLPEAPHLFNFVDVWYLIPFSGYFWNSVIVSTIAVLSNIAMNAAAGFALTKTFPGRRWVVLLLLSCMLIPFQATIIPAYLITARLGLLNSHLGLAAPLLTNIVCIFVFKSAFEAIPASLVQAARIDGLGEIRILFRILLPLAKPAIATNVILSFIWSWNAFLWPLLVTRDATMATLPLGLARFMSYVEDTTGALYAFVVMVLVPGLLVFLLAQKEFIRGLTSGATKG
jgi:ABC-type glycerol-3-phosphate transport system permease component